MRSWCNKYLQRGREKGGGQMHPQVPQSTFERTRLRRRSERVDYLTCDVGENLQRVANPSRINSGTGKLIHV